MDYELKISMCNKGYLMTNNNNNNTILGYAGE
jgi:hypothetical protein